MIAVILALAAAGMGPTQGVPVHEPAAGTLPGSPPHPPTHGGDNWGVVALQVNEAYEREARVLRAEMHSLQESDGGKLTAEHRAYIRKKATALLTAYNRGDADVPSMTEKADGSKSH